ncbi:MAG: glutamate--tRNA ligase [Candidatus Coatesbacteria bacterium]|nr:MAG: glutamate--tRNA ligase [Candidatus Coatesbacteria bacterium]
MTVRVRFAPAPTGNLHVGGARTALFNWLFARHHDGTFVLRVEDTDPERSKGEYLDSILDALAWLGLYWDEGPGVGGDYGPYMQSARGDIYREHLDRLVAGGYTYDCYCKPEELEAQREEARAGKRAYRYDGRCAKLTDDRVAAYEAEDRRPSVRFRMPRDGILSFDDLIRGTVEVPAEEYDDFIIARPDGTPTYNFVCAVDDVTMAVTHIIRGEDHVSNTPKQTEVLRALGYDPPTYAHLPLLLGPDRSRLSKRHGATSVLEYQKEGFLAVAFVNFLALLGWSYDDAREYFARDELVKYFSLDRVKKSGAVFDVEKLTWMNGTYIRELPAHGLFDKCRPWFARAGYVPGDADEGTVEYAASALALEQEKMKLLSEAPELVKPFFEEPDEYEEKAEKNVRKLEDPAQVFAELADRFDALEPFDAGAIEELIRAYAEESGVGAGKVIHAVRAALSGRTWGPSLFEMVELLGRERCVKRLNEAGERFK